MSDTGVDIDFGADGFVPVVAQDADTDEVLMLAFADREAVARTLETGRGHYYSRSRGELWEKGASSGHTQSVQEVRVDCDGDALLYRVEQSGGACHTGFHSCFHRAVEGVVHGGGDEEGGAEGEDALRVETDVDGEEVFDPDVVYD